MKVYMSHQASNGEEEMVSMSKQMGAYLQPTAVCVREKERCQVDKSKFSLRCEFRISSITLDHTKALGVQVVLVASRIFHLLIRRFVAMPEIHHLCPILAG